MDDHFYSSLHELKQQLDLMNIRTSASLNRHSLHNYSRVSPRHSNIFDRRPVTTPSQTVPMQPFDQELHALKAQQENMSGTLHHRLMHMQSQIDLLVDEIDELRSGNPQFTPPESPTLPPSPTPPTVSALGTSLCSSSSLDTSVMSKPPATIADIGGYFYPNSSHRTNGEPQYISDASVFVGRVKRALRTKSIANIETFLKGSALRWFHIGLGLDGSHSYDDEKGQTNMANFCESLLSLFGVQSFMTTDESSKQAQYTMVAPMRSAILDDYAFPALEALRPQTISGQPDAEVGPALRQAVLRYNKDHPSLSVDPDIVRGQNLLVDMSQLRRREFESRRDKALTDQKQRDQKAKCDQTSSLSLDTDASKIGQEDTQAKKAPCEDDEHVPTFNTANPCPTPPNTLRPDPSSGLILTPDISRRLKELPSIPSRDTSDSNQCVRESKASEEHGPRPIMPGPPPDSSYSATAREPNAAVNLEELYSVFKQELSSSTTLTKPANGPQASMSSAAINNLLSGASQPFPGHTRLSPINYHPYTTIDNMPVYPYPIASPPTFPTSYHNGEGLFSYKHPNPTQSYNSPLPPIGTGTDYSTYVPAAPSVASTQSNNHSLSQATGCSRLKNNPGVQAIPQSFASLARRPHPPPPHMLNNSATTAPLPNTAKRPTFGTSLPGKEPSEIVKAMDKPMGSDLCEGHSQSKRADAEEKARWLE